MIVSENIEKRLSQKIMN